MADFKQAVEWAFDNKVHTGEGYYLVLENLIIGFKYLSLNLITNCLSETHLLFKTKNHSLNNG